jgi:sugar O-acyltransferase (sialic acid O-acetyltransferase NeuD family)
MTPLVIVGAGGFGREVFTIVSALNDDGASWDVLGFVDDGASEVDCKRVADLGSTIIGTVAELAGRTDRCSVVLAVGSAKARSTIWEALKKAPIVYPTVVHPDSTLGVGVTLAEGVVIAPGARLSTNILVGRHVHVDQNATIGHDSVLGDFARLNPQACVSGSVSVGAGSTVGAAATILQGISIGEGSLVGAGAVVTRDVGDHQIVKGVPAR